MVCTALATGKYELAILLPRKVSDARDVMHLSIAISMAVAFLLMFIVIVGETKIATLLVLHDNVQLLYFLPPGVFLIGLTQSVYYYLNRNRGYLIMTSGRISRSIAYASSALAVGILSPSGIALICSDLIGYTSNCCLMIWRGRIPLKWKLTRARAKSLLRRYSDFPRYMMLAGLLEKTAGQTPIFLLNLLFHSTASIGFFTLAMRVIAVPADLIARSISDVFRQRAAEVFLKQGECRDIFVRTLKKLALLAFPFTILGFFVVEDAFRLIFGDEWATAGHYARIMLPFFFLQFIVSPLSIMIVIAEKQRYDLIMQTFLLLTTAASFFIGYHFYYDIGVAIKLFTASYCAKYMIELILSYRLSGGA